MKKRHRPYELPPISPVRIVDECPVKSNSGALPQDQRETRNESLSAWIGRLKWTKKLTTLVAFDKQPA
jgi:hypothetical protein